MGGGIKTLPFTLLSSIIHPSSPKVTITNFNFGNLKRMETSALGMDGAPVHACETRNSQIQYECPVTVNLANVPQEVIIYIKLKIKR